MELYFLRHGLAGEKHDWNGPDFDRPLTEKGVERMKREAVTIAGMGLDPERILTSPLVRASQTAEIVARKLGLLRLLVEDERLSSGMGIDQLRAIVQSYPDASSLMLVGHDPDFSETVGQLIGGGRLNLSKGAFARVNLSNPDTLEGKLIWLLPPSVLGA